ncbi:MAG TPA: hypothetical protein VER83_04785 [Candidatus Nanopelagicales bacterium]|nr:hypothetical protein [Candidatus Nanopelagicales bacterium]
MSMPHIAYDTQPGDYRPGTCNIGPAEIARRRRTGIVGIGAAVALAAGLLFVDAPTATRWLVALPLAGGAVGLLQARFRFCAAYGMAGVSNFGALGDVDRVEDAAARRADRTRALAIALAGAAIGAAGALAFVLLPL